ncbi:phage antirepressor [Fusobacterium sp. SYSU M8A802]
MEKLQIVEQREVLGKEFKIYGDFENPLFKANDVAQWIEHSNVSRMLESIDDIEKVKCEIGTLTNSYSAWFLTEDGLYEVLMQSRKPIAKAFKKEVKIILKEIRKNGGYIATSEKDSDEEIMAKALLVAQRTIKRKNEKIKELEIQVEEDKPKVLFASAVETSKSTILIGEMAKILKQNGIDIGQKRLFSWLRDNGYLIKRNGTDYNMPTQKAMEMKLFEIKETAVTHSDGHITINKTPKITGKGQVYFINKFIEVA